jgi:uncharacterized protein
MKDQKALNHQNQEELVTDARNKVQGMGLIKISTIVYGLMTLVGCLVIHLGLDTLSEVFATNLPYTEWARLGAVGALAAMLLLIFSYFFENWFESYRQLKNLITKLLGPCSFFTAIYLAFASAVGEEILFRGAIQPYAGIFITSILFGLLHLGQDGKISSWSLWAMAAGLLLGIVYESTGTIWAPVLAHFLVNAFSILKIRRSYQQWAILNPSQSPSVNDERS